MKTLKIGFIGAGNMAYAIAGGLLSLGRLRPEEVGFFDVSEERRALFSGMGMTACSSSAALVREAHIVFLAIKPQVCSSVLDEISDAVSPEQVLVSMMAGISIPFIEAKLKNPCGVILLMPNTPLLIGSGATAMARSERVGDAEYEFIAEIFSSLGTVEHLSPKQMNPVISVNGSSPAYVYLLAKAVMEGAAKQGIDPETAKRLFAQTLIGSAKMILESGREPQELIDMVTSPGGTTYKALEGLTDYRFVEGVQEAMRRCTERAEELSGTVS